MSLLEPSPSTCTLQEQWQMPPQVLHLCGTIIPVSERLNAMVKYADLLGPVQQYRVVTLTAIPYALDGP